MQPPRTQFRVDAKHPKVTEQLRGWIVSGRFRAGECLPHRDELEVLLGASRMTVQTALATLMRDGFLRTVSGHGTFVEARPPFVTDYGLLFPVPSEDLGASRFYAALQRTARTIAHEREGSMQTYFGVSSTASDEYARATSDCFSHRIAGMVFAAVTYPLQTSALIKSDFPKAAIQDGPNANFSGPCVYPNLQAFYRLAVERCAAAGRKRLAVISADASRDVATFTMPVAERCGMRCLPHHMLAVHPAWPHSSRTVIELLFSLPAGERPDALIIADDNLVTDATAALASCGIVMPRDLTVVAHANAPQFARSHVPCEYVAFDARGVIEACFAAIDLQRAGRKPEVFTRVEPIVVAQSDAGL